MDNDSALDSLIEKRSKSHDPINNLYYDHLIEIEKEKQKHQFTYTPDVICVICKNHDNPFPSYGNQSGNP